MLLCWRRPAAELPCTPCIALGRNLSAGPMSVEQMRCSLAFWPCINSRGLCNAREGEGKLLKVRPALISVPVRQKRQLGAASCGTQGKAAQEGNHQNPERAISGLAQWKTAG